MKANTATLIQRHRKAVEAFAKKQTVALNERAKWLCEQIRREVPQLKGIQLAHRSLMAEPLSLSLPVLDESGEGTTDAFDDMGAYMPSGRCGRYRLDLSPGCIAHLRELNELINYADEPERHTVDLIFVKLA